MAGPQNSSLKPLLVALQLGYRPSGSTYMPRSGFARVPRARSARRFETASLCVRILKRFNIVELAVIDEYGTVRRFLEDVVEG
jgi:hypothetical protein